MEAILSGGGVCSVVVTHDWLLVDRWVGGLLALDSGNSPNIVVIHKAAFEKNEK